MVNLRIHQAVAIDDALDKGVAIRADNSILYGEIASAAQRKPPMTHFMRKPSTQVSAHHGILNGTADFTKHPLQPLILQVLDALLQPDRDGLAFGHLHGAMVHGICRLATLQLGHPRPRWLEQRSIQVCCLLLEHLEVYPLGAAMRGIEPWGLAMPAAPGTPPSNVAGETPSRAVLSPQRGVASGCWWITALHHPAEQPFMGSVGALHDPLARHGPVSRRYMC